MRHLDLFSGIGGFAYAADQVFGEVEHIFCDNDKFCQQVLKKHWPRSVTYGDIQELIDDLERGIIVVCNEDTMASARSVVKEEKSMAQGTASPVIPGIWLDGEKPTLNTTDKISEPGTRKRSGKSTNTTEASVPVAEKQKKPSSPLTTPTVEEMKNADATTPKPGSSSLKTATPTTTKFSASTATTPNTTMGYAPIKELKIDLLTGGFPCQPFSAAGRRKGTDDNRFKWPEMLRIIRLTKPRWVIAENVRGLLNWNEGVVFEQVCADLEAEGYKVQPFIIPAVAVNAPHRRDRVWFVANSINDRPWRAQRGGDEEKKRIPQQYRKKDSTARQLKRTDGNREALRYAAHSQNNDRRTGQLSQVKEAVGSSRNDKPAGSNSHLTDSEHQRLERRNKQTAEHRQDERLLFRAEDWERNWLEVATKLCGVDDGLPAELDGFKLSKSQHRKERLKSLGNAIVPQVAIEIMKGML